MADSDSSYTCSCGYKIPASFPSIFTLDDTTLELIGSGKIFTLECPECGRKLKVDAPALFEFPSEDFGIYLLPEKQRNAYLLGKLSVEAPCKRLVIGLKELQEKVLLKINNLDDQTVEALKLPFLSRIKKNIEVFFKEVREEKLFFYVEGMKAGEIGITALPMAVYRQKLQEKDQWMTDSDLQAFLSPPYVSISQIDVEED